MKIREEDFDVNEGLDRYQNDKQAEIHENQLKNDPGLVEEMLSLYLEDISVKTVIEVVLKGDCQWRMDRVFRLTNYQEGYIEFNDGNTIRSVRWYEDDFSIS